MNIHASISALLILCCCSGFSFAQKDTVHLEPLEISGERVPELARGRLRPVWVADALTIRLLPVNDLQDLLSGGPGLDIRQRGVNGAQADISVRGGSFEQSLILLNGIRMNDPQSGHHNLNLPVETSQLSRVEFVSGPGTRMFGANAFSGAVHLITPEPDHNYLEIGINNGDFGLFSANLNAGWKQRKFSHYMAVSGKSCEGYTGNTDLGQAKVFYRGLFREGANSASLQTAYINKSFGANSFYSARYPDQFEQIRSFLIAADAHIGTKLRWEPRISWKRHHDRFELFRFEAPAWYKGHNYHMTDVLNAALQAGFSGRFGRTSLGAEYQWEHIYSNVLGELMNGSRKAPGESEGVFSREAGRGILSFALDHEYTFRWLKISAGLALQLFRQEPPAVYPGLDMRFRISKPFTAFVAVNRAVRYPTFTDLYYSGPQNQGNPDLLPEKAWEMEGGLLFANTWTSVRAAFFYRAGDHLIDWVKAEGESVWRSENLTLMNTWGPEISAGFFPGRIRDSGFFVRSVNITYHYINARKPETGLISYYVMDYLSHSLKVSAIHPIWRGLYVSWSFVLNDRAGTYTDPESGGEIPYRTYAVADLRLGWERRWLACYVGLDNIAGTEYRDFGAVPMPGRWLNTGLMIKINQKKI